MKPTIENKIKALRSIRKQVNPVSSDSKKEELEFYKGLKSDGLIEFSPDGKINSAARVRLTATGEEHLQKLKDQGFRKFLWLFGIAVVSGIITLIVRQNS
tara:strand:+ start:68 stop:367 length:300 start_codon:yes stop_codon:yes gene_type:complete